MDEIEMKRDLIDEKFRKDIRMGLEDEIEWLEIMAETSSKEMKEIIKAQIEDMRKELKERKLEELIEMMEDEHLSIPEYLDKIREYIGKDNSAYDYLWVIEGG